MEEIEDQIVPPNLTTEFVLDKCQYFADSGIWPRKTVISPERWLSNFSDGEITHALYLLNSFFYYSNDLLDEVFSGAIRTLCRLLIDLQDNKDQIIRKWSDFINTSVITYVTGENPNPTDSGYQFTRRARALGFDEGNIFHPQDICGMLLAGHHSPIIFVDDFVGSGNQFITTFQRNYGSPAHSLEELTCINNSPIYYCPAFSTEFGMQNIQAYNPKIIMNPGHVIYDNYGALHPDSIIWPSNLRDSAEEFIRSVSMRAGIPDYDGKSPGDWRGFASLGLTIAFEEGVPDASLPLFSWNENGWLPLIKVGG